MAEHSREDIQILLPFMANGTLDESDRKAVETWLESDPLLQEELADLYRLRDTFQSVESRTSGGMAGLDRLLREIGETEAKPKEVERRFFGRLPPLPLATKKMQQVAALTIGVLIVINLGIWITSSDQGRVELASSPETANLVIAFQPKVTEEKLRAVLLELDLQIVAGPSSLGLYRLYGKEPESALYSLREKTTVVESVTYAND